VKFALKRIVISLNIIDALEELQMGFRFRKTIKLFPGVKLNLSKSGISTSIGVPGATINVSKRGNRGTVGIPGTGISYSEKLSGPSSRYIAPTVDEQVENKAGMGFGALLCWGGVALFGFLLFYGFVIR
jgi:hypothetical protein